jgi:hypothetical protein
MRELCARNQAHREAQTPVVLQHERHDTQQRQRAREQLVRAPGEDAVERINIRVRAADDSALMGFVEIVQREPLNMLEDREPEIVHSALTDGNGALDLGGGEEPANQQVAEVNGADHEYPPERGLRAGEAGEVTVDTDLDELGAQQL